MAEGATGTTGVAMGVEEDPVAEMAAGSISCGLDNIFFSLVEPMSKGEM